MNDDEMNAMLEETSIQTAMHFAGRLQSVQIFD
jgi:hypothetical protein